MKADLSRTTFNPLKHFTRVLMQQGRVQLDADWNEQAAILLHYLQTLAADLIGPHGGPEDANGHCAFEISALGAPPVFNDFHIAPGHYYVDGILCEADATPIAIFPAETSPASPSNVAQADTWILDGAPLDTYSYAEVFDDSPGSTFRQVFPITTDPQKRTITLQGPPTPILGNLVNPKLRRVITYLNQPDYPSPTPLKQVTATSYQVYLDVWERHITYVEDDSIREVALGGPDTATRARLVWQVKVTSLLSDNSEDGTSVDQLNARFQWENRGRLKAMALQSAASADPCIISPDARYSGPENQLYRVEIHRRGALWNKGEDKTKGATFKFSRENGAVVFALASPIVPAAGTTTVFLETLGRDDRFGLSEDDWVEIQDDTSALVNQVGSPSDSTGSPLNQAGNLLQVQSIDRTTRKVILTGTPGITVGTDLALHPLLRRWDQKEGDPDEGGLQLGSDGAALIGEDSNTSWLTLEDGVQIQFQPPDPGRPANVYRTGDYWLIPARTETGDVEWARAKDAQGTLVPIALPPHGVAHHYAPLAVINVDGGGVQVTKPDCLHRFESLPVLT
jgi:hypothetical protein